MKKKTFYYLASLLFLLSSCTKDGLDLSGISFGPGGFVPNLNKFDSIGLSHINLPASRYFIYKDSASGQQDSVVTTVSSLTYLYPTATSNSPFHSYQTYSLTLSRITGTGGIWYSGSSSCDSVYHTAPVFIDDVFELADNQTMLPSYWYPFTSSANRLYTYIPAMIIGGKNYTNVNCFAAVNGLAPSNLNYAATVFYWVKGIGIIRKEIRTFNSIKTSLLVRYG